MAEITVSEFGVREGAILEMARGSKWRGLNRNRSRKRRGTSTANFLVAPVQRPGACRGREQSQSPIIGRLSASSPFSIRTCNEFHMVRVSGLIEQFESGVLETSPDGLTPN